VSVKCGLVFFECSGNAMLRLACGADSAEIS
jgi:hypothetical protein